MAHQAIWVAVFGAVFAALGLLFLAEGLPHP